MKTLENKTFTFKDGPVTDHTGKPYDTFSVIKTVLEESPYGGARDIIKAARINSSLKVVDDKINLEDADYEFIKLWAEMFTPLTSKGLVFLDFFQQLED